MSTTGKVTGIVSNLVTVAVDGPVAENELCYITVAGEQLLAEVKQAGWEIFNRKGNTCYGIAASTTAIIKSILFNENRILPVSVWVDGQYGIDGAYLSVPTILGADGAKEIVEIRLTNDERSALRHSAEVVSAFYRELNI